MCDIEATNIARQHSGARMSYLETNDTGGDTECQTSVPTVSGTRGIPNCVFLDREYHGELDICLRLSSTDD